jgi:hypothetical protein
LYQFFKISSKGSYEGTQLTFRNPLKSLASTIFLSFGQINVYGLKRTFFDHKFMFNLLVFSMFFVLFLILFFFLIHYLKASYPNGKMIGDTELLIILLLALSANILLGFTVKYSKIGLVYPLYLHSLISYLFLSLMFALVMIKFSGYRILAIFLSCLLSVFGYISYVDQANEYSILRNNQLVFKVVDCLASQNNFVDKVTDQVLSSDIQVASKAYTYNYFGEKLSKRLKKDIHFYMDISAVDKNLPYTEINLVMRNGTAEGNFQTIGSDTELKGNFLVSSKSCQVR